MAAKFILSLDCEGKWGSADCLRPRHRTALSDERLSFAYQAILSLLDEHDLAATFAFAGLFSQSADQFARLRPQVETFAAQASNYLNPALSDIDATGGTGWHGAQLVSAVGAALTEHEIALHGVTHVPWRQMTDSLAAEELALFNQLEGPVRNSRTFVYPRNLVAHTDALKRHGFLGYRQARPMPSRAASLAAEIDLFAQPEAAVPAPGLVPIPAGFFLNWRSGPRRLVPPAVTIGRARGLLDRAERSGAVVHYWLHPENVATAPATLDLLRALIEEVARRRDAARCDVMTQLAYCQWARSLA